ncbi:MAG: hypothetical protein CSA81_05275 [Acidobacteria bacterium]|nr:MAG: hypothetical protein CSA81_05275 [Acidobacteriota bacterium]
MSLLLCTLFLSFGQPKGLPTWVQQRLNPDLKPLSTESQALLVYRHRHISSKDSKLIIQDKMIYQLTRAKGTGYGSLILPLDLKSKAKQIKGWRFDRHGKVIETLKKENIVERAYNLSFYDDSKQIFISFDHVEMGDWVAFEYTEHLNAFFGDVVLRLGQPTDILESQITYADPIQATVLNDPAGQVLHEDRTITLKNWQAPYDEPNAPNHYSLTPSVGLVWKQEHHANWSEFGHYYHNMIQALTSFTEPYELKLNEIMKQNDKEKLVLELVRYVRESVNYVAIEFGKGGFVPRSCNFVHQKKYGDCKDMACYAVSLLKQKGISAFPVLSRTSHIGKVFPEFIGDQFNHMVMAVKLDAETRHLANATIDKSPYMIVDLTDAYTPLPLISSGIEGTKGLLVNAENSQLFDIPYNPPEKSRIDRMLKAHLDGKQTLNVLMQETHKGRYFGRFKAFFDNLTEDKKQEKLESYLDHMVPGSYLNSFDIQLKDDEAVFSFTFYVPYYGIDSHDGLLVIPNLVDLKNNNFKKRSRTTPLLLPPHSEMKTVIQFTWDPSWQVISEPASGSVQSDFFEGSFSVKKMTTSSTAGLQLIKENTWKRPVVQPEEYKAFRKAYKAFRKKFKSPITLKRK